MKAENLVITLIMAWYHFKEENKFSYEYYRVSKYGGILSIDNITAHRKGIDRQIDLM